MRNFFLFIRRYITFITFLTLQGISLWMLFKYNRVHHAAGLGMASEITGRINSQVDKLDDYFHQGEKNRMLHHMNDSLMNLLRENFVFPDTGARVVIDSIPNDTLGGIRKYLYRDAKVIYNTLDPDKNYMQLSRGSKGGITDDMAVLDADGSVAGIVVNVSPNFSQVMSLLHRDNVVNAALKRTGDAGRVKWTGKDYRYLTMEGISRSVDVKIGDTVVTSPYSYNFPPGRLIGVVMKKANDPATGFYLLTLRSATNFNRIQQVFVVENLMRKEQLELDEQSKDKVNKQNPKH